MPIGFARRISQRSHSSLSPRFAVGAPHPLQPTSSPSTSGAGSGPKTSAKAGSWFTVSAKGTQTRVHRSQPTQRRAENLRLNLESASSFSNLIASVGQPRAQAPQAEQAPVMERVAKPSSPRRTSAAAFGADKCATPLRARKRSRPGRRPAARTPFSMARAIATCPWRAIIRNRSRRESGEFPALHTGRSTSFSALPDTINESDLPHAAKRLRVRWTWAPISQRSAPQEQVAQASSRTTIRSSPNGASAI